MIMTLGRSAFTHQAGVMSGYMLCGLYISVRGQAASMRPGS